MNVLQITAYADAGQRFNGYVLNKRLQELGHDTHMAVQIRDLDDPNVHKLGRGWLGRLNVAMARIERALSLHSILASSAFQLYSEPFYKNADIVHLQLVHAEQFFSLLNLPIMSRQHNLVWTLHDPWLTSGHCVHSLECDKWLKGCKKCDFKNLWFPINYNTTGFVWLLKYALTHISRINLVVASRCMLKRVKQSPIVSHLPCDLIPFGVCDVFEPQDKAFCREKLGIPADAKVLGFRARCISDVYKGFGYIEKALEVLDYKRHIYLITLDMKGWSNFSRNRYTLIELGWLSEPRLLSEAFNAMDVFLMPSIAETFGMMAVESMACGTPVICFDGTSIPEVIHAPRAGIVVPYKDYVALSKAIQLLLDDDLMRESLSTNCLKVVKEEYSESLYVSRHLDLYERILRT